MLGCSWFSCSCTFLSSSIFGWSGSWRRPGNLQVRLQLSIRLAVVERLGCVPRPLSFRDPRRFCEAAFQNAQVHLIKNGENRGYRIPVISLLRFKYLLKKYGFPCTHFKTIRFKAMVKLRPGKSACDEKQLFGNWHGIIITVVER